MASTRKKNADVAPSVEISPMQAGPELKIAAAAYAKWADERKSLGERPELPATDLGQVLDIARKALPKLLTLREEIAETLPKHPLHYLENLESYLLAAAYSDKLVSLTANSEVGSDQFNKMIEDARQLRKLLLASAEPLALKGLVEETKVRAIRSGAGHEDLATDLIELAALYHEAWPRIKNKTAVESEEVEQSRKLGIELTDLLILRKSDSAKFSPEECLEQRDRAYTLLLRAYDETARAVSYLRWHEKDADTFAPTLIKSKRGRSAKGETTAAPPPVAEVMESEDTSNSDEVPAF